VGHFVTNCPLRKSNKGFGEGSEHEALASQFKLDFTLFACMVSSMVGSGWFLDIGASLHMIDDKSLFSTLVEKDSCYHSGCPYGQLNKDTAEVTTDQL